MKTKSAYSPFNAVTRRLLQARLKRSPANGDEIERTLRRSCRSVAHATAVVTHVIDTWSYCPTPAELVALAREVQPTAEAEARAEAEAKPRSYCGQCFEGRALVFLLVEMRGGRPIMENSERLTREQAAALRGKLESNQAIYEALETCSCVKPKKNS